MKLNISIKKSIDSILDLARRKRQNQITYSLTPFTFMHFTWFETATQFPGQNSELEKHFIPFRR